jgi:hypothetical protein
MPMVDRIPVLSQMRCAHCIGILGGLMQMRMIGFSLFAKFAGRAKLKICSNDGESFVFTF